MQVNTVVCMMDQGYGYCRVCLCLYLWSAQPASQGAGPKLGSLAPALASPNCLSVVWLPGRSHGSLFHSSYFFACERARQSLSTAPSVTPGSRRGHPNCLAESLAVPPWALLAPHQRGLQLLAESQCGPHMGVLMSLTLRLRWHWTRKSGPGEDPQRSSPCVPSI